MLDFDRERVRVTAEAADTQDLLDRVTLYRDGMEPEALTILEEELRRRGVTAARQVDHEEERRKRPVVADGEGLVRRCERCGRPAAWRGWGWHRLWGWLPLLPRRVTLCEEHHGGSSARGG